MSQLSWSIRERYYIQDSTKKFSITKFVHHKNGKTIYEAWSKDKVFPKKSSINKKLKVGIGEKYFDNGCLGQFKGVEAAKEACEEYRKTVDKNRK